MDKQPLNKCKNGYHLDCECQENIECSHKATEWREYRMKKKRDDGLFPPTKHCQECEESRKLKQHNLKNKIHEILPRHL